MSTSPARTLASPPLSLDEVVDTERYPLTDPGGGRARRVVADARRELAAVGCTVLPDFVRPALHEALREQCAALAPRAHYDVETVNVYNIDVDPDLPADHPGRVPFRRGNAFVARDLIPHEALISVLYQDEAFQRFVADCFGLPRLHPLADPLSGLVLNVVRPGMEHPWHFDTNEYTVSMLTQQPDSGGEFEYCPGIRTAEAENFGDVRDVITGGGRHLVSRLPLRPGDLQLFKGRYSLHRVSPVAGERDRHSAIFAYSERPGVVGSAARTRQLFGRVLPQHHAEHAVRTDELLD
ncbi:HalD/BesD family halogenase [Streptomyces alkaliterrae]|uniref:ArpA protein n=1 Tax=Streptomyces alkaliterrae TaxID=2213162 RepID=A0A5P0YPW0_9ACTN|nr:arpA protein [Streptomyces alkaliterrae]MBB1256626.1 arpA protein [Streptomyces alkaliterrae]MBB1259263.1 arpA protein [Streptomyces alkaliterrae]MQS02404.1 arpA protein [Streptomyces alkaliterrae]